jgi:hypothetical protein
MSLTYRLFARRCAYIAKNCSEWAGDSLDLKAITGLEKPVPLGVVRRFTEEVRARLDSMERDALGPADITGEGK